MKFVSDPRGYVPWVRPGPLQAYPGKLPYEKIGFDPVCSAWTRFYSPHSWFRDSYISDACKTQPRERALAFVLANLLPGWKKISKLHESSPNPDGISAALMNLLKTKYIGSQYDPTTPCGETSKGASKGEIALNLEKQECIADEMFDMVVTQDVFEHVYNAESAFKEIARTLKPAGIHIFTVPTPAKQFGTFKAATMGADGEVTLHAPPEIHGNPMGIGGSLLTRQWGYDIVDMIKEQTGMETKIIYVQGSVIGVDHAEYREVYVSKKPGHNPILDKIFDLFDTGFCYAGKFTCKVEEGG